VAIAFQHASAGHALGSAIATAALSGCYMNGWVRRAGPLLFILFYFVVHQEIFNFLI
jgi:hypothetical protein